MPFTTKLKADYIELINQSLDTIMMDTVEDFAVVQQALENMLELNPEYQVTEKYKEKMISINFYLNEPEDYVQHESDYAEYQQIIKERIESKIKELGSLNTEQKQTYIQVQAAAKAQVATNQQAMSHHTSPLPGSEAHVISLEEHLAELERRFNRTNEYSNDGQSWISRMSSAISIAMYGTAFPTRETPARQNIFASMYQAMVAMFSSSDTTQPPAPNLPDFRLNSDIESWQLVNEISTLLEARRPVDLVHTESTRAMLGKFPPSMPEDERLADLEPMRAPDSQSSTPPTASANNQHQSQPNKDSEETESQSPRPG